MEIGYRAVEIAGVFVSLACCIIVSRSKPSQNQQRLLLTFILGLTACIGNLFEVFAASPEAAMMAIKVAYIGKSYIITAGLMFVSCYSSVKLPKWLMRFLGIANTVVLLMVVTCEHHRLYYWAIDYEVRPNGRVAMMLTPGPFYMVWMWLIVLGAVMYIVIVRHEIRLGTRIAKLRKQFFLLALVLPVMVVGFLIIKPPYFDPVSLEIMLAETCFLIALKRFGILDTMELAQERIIEDTKDGIVVIDSTKSMIMYQNKVAESFIKRLAEKNVSIDLEQFAGEYERVYELDGRHYEFRVSEIMRGTNQIQGYVVWIFDMTFIDEYTNEMIRLKDEAEKANQAKTDFLANISHEIRTPMNSIVGYAEIALETSDNKAVREYLKKIKKSSDTLLHLINELIDITKIESGRMRLIKVDYSFKDMVDEIRMMHETEAGNAGIAFIIQLDGRLPVSLYGDKIKVREIITSLITNGIKYTHQGSVALRVRVKDTFEKKVLLHIEVEDTGIGISEEEGDRIFAKFERSDRKKNYHVAGSGLGLAIAKSFVDMMDGTISYESKYGKGTRFIVDIWQELGQNALEEEEGQQTENAEDTDNATEEKEPEVVINSGNIMIVDDNMLNLEVASGIMELLGMNTKTVESGIECLELLKGGEKPDIIFMDHMMPELDGLETMKIIRQLDSEVSGMPIVLLTANAVAGVRESMLEEGFDDFLSKPIDVDELKRILLRFLGEKGCQAD